MKDSRGTRHEMREEMDHSASENVQRLETAINDIIDKIANKGMLPKDAIGLDSEVVEGIYAQAYRLYNTGKYADATYLFRLLVMLNATENKYILGLAASLHMLKDYKSAIEAYTLCSIMDPENPLPQYHCSDCFIQMKDYLSAMLCLEMTIKRAGDKAEFAQIKERAALNLESLKKQQQQAPKFD